MKKKGLIIGIVAIIAITVVLFLAIGIKDKTNSNGEKGANISVAQNKKGNYDVFESIKRINTKTTLEEINNIMGFEGNLESQADETSNLKWKLYTWQLTDDTSIEVRIYDDSDEVYITAYYPNDMIKNKKVDFSKADDMEKKINEAEGLTYEEVVKMVGGVEGTLEEKDASTDTYTWVDSEGGSLTARFSTKTGKCTSFNGVF